MKVIYELSLLQQLVPEEAKDKGYWDRREKNNVAARRSREARRLKENQIALRASFLERENSYLKTQFEDLTGGNVKLEEEISELRSKISKFEMDA